MESFDTPGDRGRRDAAIPMGTLLVNRDLQLQWITPPAKELLGLRDGSYTPRIDDVIEAAGYETFTSDARQVLKDLSPLERVFKGRDEKWHRAWIRPYLSPEDQVEGLTVTFFRVTARRRAQQVRHEAGDFAADIVDTIREGLLVLDPDLRVESANIAFCEMFKVSLEETEGTLIYELGNGQWDIPELRELLEEVLPDDHVFNDYRINHRFEYLGERTMLLNGRRLDHVDKILLVIEDITERWRAEEKLKALNAELRREIARRECLEQEVLQVSAEERFRIGESLHEGAGQALTGVHMLLGDHIRRLKEKGVDGIEEVEKIRTLIKEVDEQLLDLARGIIPLELGEGDSLRRALENLVGQMEERFALRGHLRIEGDFASESHERATHVYRIVEEAAQNAVLRGGASDIDITLTQADGRRMLIVEDNGTGPEAAIGDMSAQGLGLRLTQYRCRLLKGDFSLEERAGGGLRVVCGFPVEEPSIRASS